MGSRVSFLIKAIVSLIFLVAQPFQAEAAEVVSCECPKLACNACEVEQGVSFYSEKCGENGARVRSCAKPTCIMPENPAPNCKGASAKTTTEHKTTVAETANLSRGVEIGTIQSLEGNAWVKLPNGSRIPAAIGTAVHERDSVQTEKNARIKLEFKDGNITHVQDDTLMKVDEYETSEDKRKAVINLIRGKIRNQVKQKYNGATTSYQVITKTAVAGVRGTDFIASYFEGDRSESKIETLEGKVVLANLDFSQTVEVAEAQQAAYVVNSGAGPEGMEDLVARGYMTAVQKINGQDYARLDSGTLIGAQRGLASTHSKKSLCALPKAELNQCSWTCENNPKGEANCRTDLPNVNCVRRRCNANGLWAEDTRLPASYHEQCKGSAPLVAPCDY